MNDKLRVGAINWDNSLPEDTYFGFHSTSVLSYKKFRNVTPFYANVEGEKVSFRQKTQADVDRELELAMAAGIDYMAYDWYTDDHMKDKGKPGNVDHTVWELNHARYLHQTSKYADKIHLCALLICLHPFVESDMARLAEAMKQSYYETVDGRPLVYLYGGFQEGFIAKMRAFPQEYGTKEPYIVFLEGGGGSKIDPNKDYSKADAVCAYACCALNTTRYSEVIDCNLQYNENRKGYGIPVLPHFTLGWNPQPRVDHPIPWTTYPDVPYALPASEEEIVEGAKRLADWVKANKDNVVPDRILAFAWNEFEEGAFICPTVDGENNYNDSHLKGFAKAVACWKETL